MNLRFSNGPEYHRLKKVLIYRPGDEVARVTWSNYRDMLFRRPVNPEKIRGEFEKLKRILRDEGVETITLNDLFEEVDWRPATVPPNMIFMRDVMGVLGRKVYMGVMRHEARRFEPNIVHKVFKRLGVENVHIIGEGYFEGGDLIQLNRDYLMIGYGPRTDFIGAYRLALEAAEQGLNTILVSMPPFRVHLDGGLMPIGRDIILLHRPTLDYYPSLVVYKDGEEEVVNAYSYLAEQGYTYIEVDDDEARSFGPNVAVINSTKILAYRWNVRTIDKLRDAGYDVIPFEGGEYRGAGGGPHCIFNTIERG